MELLTWHWIKVICNVRMKTVAAADAEEEGRRRHRRFMMKSEDNVFKKAFLISCKLCCHNVPIRILPAETSRFGNSNVEPVMSCTLKWTGFQSFKEKSLNPLRIYDRSQYSKDLALAMDRSRHSNQAVPNYLNPNWDNASANYRT